MESEAQGDLAAMGVREGMDSRGGEKRFFYRGKVLFRGH